MLYVVLSPAQLVALTAAKPPRTHCLETTVIYFVQGLVPYGNLQGPLISFPCDISGVGRVVLGGSF